MTLCSLFPKLTPRPADSLASVEGKLVRCGDAFVRGDRHRGIRDRLHDAGSKSRRYVFYSYR